ncbi:ATP-GRASP peptide maturase, grasp-with-spasm system [Tenacibaculum sp. MAR_2009_124]|uniref:grasp-with-spasm system ATP-grasp peptide maturase n=1 Tax=Tenacibaculum sp. MAR_2009_124 TaxID=1250059 RepID=UPI0008942E99|nr:grasp-with-spasm system ATP-grasp peptide maturase [Tenacibaculum sp. MAR_2009_124]SEC64789.1 ATP-GRASP peptide maturase, grasp-with-spasm system [Tenacibaculum sp. MAR_2009_124]
MILVISNSSDSSTSDVIAWLVAKKAKWTRINREDKVHLEFLINEIKFNVNNTSFYLSEVKTIWYRRGFISNDFLNFSLMKKEGNTAKGILDFLDIESETLREYFYYQLHQKKHLNSLHNGRINKLITCEIAKSVGLDVPDSFILSNRGEFQKIASNKRLITKALGGDPHILLDDKNGMMYTKEVTKINEQSFFPSLFQEMIIKKYELRIFYLDGDFYSMAIFSQEDKQTQVDFRKYNDKVPNRTVPYKLPSEIERKLHLLMQKIGRNCGSIDMMVSSENKYYFLEINPGGQFGMVSYPCNYHLEEKIAEYLIQ